MSGKQTIWTVQAPRVMDKAVKATVDNGLYKTKAELIREAVREKLEKQPTLSSDNRRRFEQT